MSWPGHMQKAAPCQAGRRLEKEPETRGSHVATKKKKKKAFVPYEGGQRDIQTVRGLLIIWGRSGTQEGMGAAMAGARG